MELRRFFIDKQKRTGNTVLIDGEEFIHMNRVLRLKTNDDIIVCFNDGYDNFAKITQCEKNFAKAEIYVSQINKNEPTLDITLFQALIKGEKEDLLIQKAVELGVNEIYPFESENCTVKIKEGEKKSERLNKIAQEAAKQCKRAKITHIHPFITFKELLNKLKNFSVVIFASELEEKNSLIQYLNSVVPLKNVALIIGSEGGFTQNEHKALTESKAYPITMGNRILRAETAGIALISAITFYCGEWEKR